jgi:hypothetical protein
MHKPKTHGPKYCPFTHGRPARAIDNACNFKHPHNRAFDKARRELISGDIDLTEVLKRGDSLFTVFNHTDEGKLTNRFSLYGFTSVLNHYWPQF